MAQALPLQISIQQVPWGPGIWISCQHLRELRAGDPLRSALGSE